MFVYFVIRSLCRLDLPMLFSNIEAYFSSFKKSDEQPPHSILLDQLNVTRINYLYHTLAHIQSDYHIMDQRKKGTQTKKTKNILNAADVPFFLGLHTKIKPNKILFFYFDT